MTKMRPLGGKFRWFFRSFVFYKVV